MKKIYILSILGSNLLLANNTIKEKYNISCKNVDNITELCFNKKQININNNIKIQQIKIIKNKTLKISENLSIDDIQHIKKITMSVFEYIYKDINPSLYINNLVFDNKIKKIYKDYIIDGTMKLKIDGIQYKYEKEKAKIYKKEIKTKIENIIRKTLKKINISDDKEIKNIIPNIYKTVIKLLHGMYRIDAIIKYKQEIKDEIITYDLTLFNQDGGYIYFNVFLKIPNYNIEIYKDNPDLDLIIKNIKVNFQNSAGFINKKENKNDKLYNLVLEKYNRIFKEKVVELAETVPIIKNDQQTTRLLIDLGHTFFNMLEGKTFFNFIYNNDNNITISDYINSFVNNKE